MVKMFTLAYLEKDEKILMLHRIKKKNDIHEGLYNGLGGKFEEGESPEECVIREIKEESGYGIKSLKLVGFLTFPKFWYGEDGYVFVYTSNDFDGEMIESLEGNLEWVDKNKILDLKLNEGDYIFMPWIFENKFFSAKFNYVDKKLKDWNVNFH